ncbi:MAG: helicase-related protein, partial [Burkholderiales bacterium]
ETPSKMDRVAGIQTGGSERAFDVYMKARYLSEKNPGHGVTFATGTPISNTMVEMYTMQRFLDPEGLKSRGIEHFDAWAATFGEVVESMEIAPDGAGLRSRSRFAKFTNLPELQQMFRAFADVQSAEMLNLPRPALRGGKPEVVASPMSAEQSSLQSRLVDRYEKIRSTKVDPRIDNALAITTDGRKLATDARMVDPQAHDFPDSKVNRLVENVHRIWEESAETRGTQLIFADMVVNPTSWGYSPYEEIVTKLIERGIPPEQIASIGVADSDAKKQLLFEKVRNGTVRVLLGSTQKMGTGTNVQKRLVALHHLDAPWNPAEVEQRDGRILRQGNLNKEVEIFRYVTQGSFDSYMWQALETKARFIGQVMTGENTARRAEDIGGQELSFAEVKAIASGNPSVLTLAEADAELQRLAILRKNHLDDQYVARRRVRDLPEIIAGMNSRLAAMQADHEAMHAHAGEGMRINGQRLSREDLILSLEHRLERLPSKVVDPKTIPLGTWNGLECGIILGPVGNPDAYLKGAGTRGIRLNAPKPGPRAILNGFDRLSETLAPETSKLTQDISIASSQLHDYGNRLDQTFPHETYQTQLTTLRDALKNQLSNAANPDMPSAAELSEQIKLLKSNHAPDANQSRTERSVNSSAEPVASLVRKRLLDVSAASETVEPVNYVSRIFSERQASADELIAV